MNSESASSNLIEESGTVNEQADEVMEAIVKEKDDEVMAANEVVATSTDAPANQVGSAPKPKKAVGLAEGLSLTVGSIIGSGIFIAVNPTFDVCSSDSIGLAVLIWVIGGLLTMLGALCYVELGIRIPLSGGERAYFLKALNPKFSTLFVIIFPFFIKSLTLSALGLTCGKYFLVMITQNTANIKYVEKLIAIVVLLFCFILNCVSRKITNKAGIVFTVLKLIAVIIIIVSGIYFLAIGNVIEWKKPFDLKEFDALKLGIAIINVEWSLEGWNTPGLIAGDMKNPARILPLSVIIGVPLVIVLYALMIVSYTSILGIAVVRASETVAMNVALKVLKQAYPIIPLLIFFSALGATNGTFFAMGGLMMSGGLCGDLPKVFSLVQRKQRTPIFSLFILLALSLIFLSFDFQVLLNYVAFMTWIFYFISMCCIYILRLSKKHRDTKSTFKVPFIFVAIFQLLCIFMIVMSFYTAYSGCIAFALVMIIILGYQYIPERYRKFNFLSSIHDKFCRFLEKYLRLEAANNNDIS